MAAVADLCTEIGYDELNEQAIASRAGLPLDSMRSLFPGGRDECLTAAEEAALAEVVAAISGSYSADRSEWESVIYGVRAILELMAAHPSYAYLGYVFSRYMSPDSVREINDSGHRIIEAMLERGREYFGSDSPPRTALGILGGAQAIIRRELVAGRPARLPTKLPDCVYIATVPFLGQREALRLAREAEELIDRSP